MTNGNPASGRRGGLRFTDAPWHVAAAALAQSDQTPYATLCCLQSEPHTAPPPRSSSVSLCALATLTLLYVFTSSFIASALHPPCATRRRALNSIRPAADAQCLRALGASHHIHKSVTGAVPRARPIMREVVTRCPFRRIYRQRLQITNMSAYDASLEIFTDQKMYRDPDCQRCRKTLRCRWKSYGNRRHRRIRSGVDLIGLMQSYLKR